jgi:hypothetical protein
LLLCYTYYHFLQDQYLAIVLGPGFEQLCLALNALLALGFDFLIFIVFCPAFLAVVPPCPKFTFFTLIEPSAFFLPELT